MNPSLLLIPDRYKASKLYSQIPDSGAGDLAFTRALDTATRVNSAGLIEAVASGIPRIDYTGGGCGKLLLEPQRTNVFTYSNDFGDAAWGKTNVSVSGSQVGVNTVNDAFLLTENSANGLHVLVQIPIVSGSHTVSVYAKAGSRNFVYLRGVQGGVNTRAWFNLANGTVGTLEGGATAKINPSANGYYRCEMTLNHDSGFEFYIGISETNGVPSYTGNGTGTIFVQNAQLEAGSYPTSYIPTLGASVTRSADAASKTGISSLIGQTEGTIYVEEEYDSTVFNNGGIDDTLVALTDGTSDNMIAIFHYGNANSGFARLASFFIRLANATQVTINSVALNTGTYKMALAYSNNDVVAYINGVQIGTDTSATIPATSVVTLVDPITTNAATKTVNIKSVAVYTTRLSNAELQTLTTL